MAVVENGKAVLRDSSGALKLVPEAQAAAAIERFGWQEASEDDIARDDLQKAHGGEKLATVAGSAAEQAAKRLSQVSALAGEVDAMGNPVTTVEPIAPANIPAAVGGIPLVPSGILSAANNPELAARQAANPVSAGIGKGLADLPIYAAAGAATGGVGASVAGGLGAGAIGSGIAAAATSSAALGAGQEIEAAHEEHRPIDYENMAKAMGLNLAFEGVGFVGAKAVGAALGAAEKPMQRAVQNSVDRAAVAADDLADPAVRASARAETRVKIEDTAAALHDAAESVKPPVAVNIVAQRTALRQLADAHPDLIEGLEAAVKRPRQQRYQSLIELRDTAETPEAAEALNALVQDRSLWGDAAVDHSNTMQALADARAAGPEALADAARSIKDPDVQRLVNDLDAHFDDMSALDAADAFEPRRSVGAAGDGPEVMPAREVEHFIKNDDDIVDNMRTVAGGGPGEKGAFQDFNESFREVTANRVKREDFVAAAPTDEPTRAALMAERDAVADSLHDVTRTMGERGAKGKVSMLNTHLQELRAAPVEEIAGVLDRTKQVLDDLHMRAIIDKTDPYGEVIGSVDPVVNRIRGTLENPAYVGDKIAELQQVRNAAWSDKDSGFIRNMQIANETGVKLFKKIDRDYHTGDLVMQFDPGAFKQLLALDAHESKPVLEAWAKVLDSAERMGANTAEVGAKSAGRAPLGKLQESIEAIRDIFVTQDKRLAARDLARPGQDLLSRVEALPGAGAVVKGAKAIFGKERVEAFAAGQGSAYVPVKVRSVGKARDALRNLGGETRVRPTMQPSPPPGAGPGPGAAGAIPLRKAAPSRVVGEVAEQSVPERAAAAAEARQRQAGHVVIQGEATPKIDKLATKLQDKLDRYKALEAKGASGAPDELGANDLGEAHTEALSKARDAVDESLQALKAEYDQAIDDITGAGYTAPEALKARTRAKYDRLVSGRDELQAVLEQHSEKLSDTQGSYLNTDAPKAAEKYLSGRATADTEAGHVDAGGFAGGLATSPLGVVTGGGLTALAAHKGYQMLDDPEHGADDAQARYLASAGARDTTATARALTDPEVASSFARRSRGQPSTLGQFQGDHETIGQAFTAQRGIVERMLRDPSTVVDSLSEAFGGLTPELRDKLSAKAFQVATYLHGQLPPQRGVSPTRPNGLPPNPLEARTYALKYMTATQPSTAFDDAKRGTLRHEQVDTLKATWPEQYADLKQQTLEAMTAGKSTILQRQRADLLFGFQTALDPAFSSRLSAAAAAARAEQPQPGGAAPSGAPAKSRVTADLQPGGIAAINQ